MFPVDMLLQASPLAQLFVGLIALAVVILIGRFALQIAWKLVLVATVLVGIAYALSVFSLI